MVNYFAPERVLLSVLDVRKPDFAHQCLVWSRQTRREMQELVVSTKKQIDISHDLLSDMDRVLTRR